MTFRSPPGIIKTAFFGFTLLFVAYCGIQYAKLYPVRALSVVGNHQENDIPRTTVHGARHERRKNQSGPHAYSGLYEMPSSDEAIYVGEISDFREKITLLNAKLSDIRRNLTYLNSTLTFRESPWTLIAGNQEGYLLELARVPAVTGVVLSWSDDAGYSSSEAEWSSRVDEANILVHDYYPWVGSDTVCRLLRGKHFTRHRFETVFDRQCTTNKHASLRPRSISKLMLNNVQINSNYYWPNGGDRYPERFHTDLPRFITFLHVIKDGFVTKQGDVFTGHHKIVPYNCKPKFNAKGPTDDPNKSPIIDEVFSLSQYWGGAFFHKMLEDFPKISPYVEFLKQHPDIKVQVHEAGGYTTDILGRLGIDKSRLVVGDVRARVIYLPRGTSCGFTLLPEVQLFSNLIRQTIDGQTEPRRTLVLVRRSVERHFTHQREIEAALRTLAKKYTLDFFLFKDDPLPSVETTMRRFNQAVLVVAPHGAGLSNLVYARPGTFVVEGLCEEPHTNMCYTRLAHFLGHRYHALMSRGGCEGHVDIPTSEISDTVEQYLDIMKLSGFI